MENDITIIFVSFHSEDIIEKSIATINHNIPIIVIENSRNFTFKEKLEKKIFKYKSNYTRSKSRKWSWDKLWNKKY